MSPFGQRLNLALKDIRDGVCSFNIWGMLGWLEIKQIYRRSTLGPMWLTISTSVLILGMGLLYGRLFNQDLSSYFPYLAVSIVLWSFISGLIIESCNSYITAEGFIKELKLPYTVHVLRVVWRLLIVLAHNFVIVVLVLGYFRPPWGWELLLAPVAMLLIAINGLWLGILMGLLSARFRDIPLIVTSVVQIAFFLTPIFWKPSMLGGYRWIADLNPLFIFLEIVRAPLLGEPVRGYLWVAAFVVTVVGFSVTLLLFSRYRARIAYWV
jgi:ABC-2 type transport system permease protein/lipopolysaccharide transport system permease protein